MLRWSVRRAVGWRRAFASAPDRRIVFSGIQPTGASPSRPARSFVPCAHMRRAPSPALVPDVRANERPTLLRVLNVRPVGHVHIGNYLGAVRPWVKVQHQADRTYISLVDLHSLTAGIEPKKLRNGILEMAATLMSAGIGAVCVCVLVT